MYSACQRIVLDREHGSLVSSYYLEYRAELNQDSAKEPFVGISHATHSSVQVHSFCSSCFSFVCFPTPPCYSKVVERSLGAETRRMERSPDAACCATTSSTGRAPPPQYIVDKHVVYFGNEKQPRGINGPIQEAVGPSYASSSKGPPVPPFLSYSRRFLEAF